MYLHAPYTPYCSAPSAVTVLVHSNLNIKVRLLVSRLQTVSRHKVTVYFSMTHHGVSLVPTAHPTPPQECNPLGCSTDFVFFRGRTLTLQKCAINYASSVISLCQWSPVQGNFYDDCCLLSSDMTLCSLERSTDVSGEAALSGEMSLHICRTARNRVSHDNLHRYRQTNM
jgi:hypothetical protein